MNNQKDISYILDIPKFTVKNSLEHTREFLDRLGNPEKGKKIIHVAGTNGKGSVCIYLQEMLLAEGKTTGLFISPHLQKMNERIKINGCDISDEMFHQVFMEVKEVVESMQKDGLPHPTFFEFLFGMAMKAFELSNVDYLILETGIGGRLDATNAVREPLACVITSVSIDHKEILGDTVEKIAKEKAGIIKKGAPVFCLDNEKSTKVIEERAQDQGVPCIKISKNAYEIIESDEKHIAFSTMSAYDKYTTWELHNSGIYQADNAMLAIKTMEYICGNEKHPEKWKKALSKVVWPGRMEEVLPGVIVDGAHNQGAIEAFTKSVNNNHQEDKTIILFSAVCEKEYEKMIEYLCNHIKADLYIITEIHNLRGLKSEQLASVFEKYTDVPVVAEKDFEKAFLRAREEKGETGRLYCLGSLYLVGMIKELTGGDHDA